MNAPSQKRTKFGWRNARSEDRRSCPRARGERRRDPREGDRSQVYSVARCTAGTVQARSGPIEGLQRGECPWQAGRTGAHPVLALVDTPRPSPPRRRAVRGPLLPSLGPRALRRLGVPGGRIRPAAGVAPALPATTGRSARPVPQGGQSSARSWSSLSLEREASVVIPRCTRDASCSEPDPAGHGRHRADPAREHDDARRQTGVSKGRRGGSASWRCSARARSRPRPSSRPGSGRSRWVKEIPTQCGPWTSGAARRSRVRGSWRRRPDQLGCPGHRRRPP